VCVFAKGNLRTRFATKPAYPHISIAKKLAVAFLHEPIPNPGIVGFIEPEAFELFFRVFHGRD
jgi:hypothetical protein